MKLTSLITAIVLAAPLFACTDVTEPGDVIDETAAAPAAGAAERRVYHYEPSVQDVYFAIGCGIVRIDQPPCPVGWKMTFTKNFIDLIADINTRVDERRRTVTITLDTWSYSQVHSRAAVHPETVDLPELDAKTSLNKVYHVTVLDRQHQTLFEGDVRPAYAY
jgi:hypothetical protein